MNRTKWATPWAVGDATMGTIVDDDGVLVAEAFGSTGPIRSVYAKHIVEAVNAFEQEDEDD